MIRNNDSLAHRRLKGTMDVLFQNCDTYLSVWPSLQAGAGAGKTKLDRHRLKTCKTHIVSANDRRSFSVFNQQPFYIVSAVYVH